jgi:hypothetical protein
MREGESSRDLDHITFLINRILRSLGMDKLEPSIDFSFYLSLLERWINARVISSQIRVHLCPSVV